MKRTVLFILFVLLSMSVYSQNWGYIQTSGEYYYGVGQGTTIAEASEMAMAELISMIATNVSDEFESLYDETDMNRTVEHQTKVRECIKTYSQGLLSNVEEWVIGKEPNVTVRRYVKSSELARIYEGRIAKAQDMALKAQESLMQGKVDMALQYYYWAYSLIRSIQRPNEAKDREGHLLINWIPMQIEDILSRISVNFEQRDGDFVDLLFNYDGKPVSSLDFNYSDGHADCQGSAKDGRGIMEMASGHKTRTYHISIEYEYLGQARGDAEMESVLSVVGKKVFSRATFVVKRKAVAANRKPKNSKPTGVNLNPQSSQTVAQDGYYVNVIDSVIQAIKRKETFTNMRFFTDEGMEMFCELIGYGTGRVVGTPNMKFFKSANGKVVARGLQMSFTFKSGVKKTYVEDVVFTFNAERKIESIAFGLGQLITNNILCNYKARWKDESREMLMEFLESYKTAYSLKRLDYIRDNIFNNDVIIINNVSKRLGTSITEGQERSVSQNGQRGIHYNSYTKKQHLAQLEDCFRRKGFINIRFSNIDIKKVDFLKHIEGEIYAIQIGQEFNSSNYADMDCLYLMVDMTNEDELQIKIRIWQPNEIFITNFIDAGYFFSE